MAYSDGPKVVTNGLVLALDASDRNSYISGSTNWRDVSGNNNNANSYTFGTSISPSYQSLANGTIQFTRVGQFAGNSMTFNDTSFANLTSQVTLSVWFYATTSALMIIAGKSFRTQAPAEFQSYQIYTNGTNLIGRITAGGTTNNTDITTTFTLNTWNHVVLTYNGSTMILYKNGILAQSAAKSGNLTNVYSFPFAIGGQWNGDASFTQLSEFFNGYISQVFLYNRALVASEVLQNYNSQKSRFGL